MPLVINMLAHQGPAQGNKEIVMGKKADYYPPGATEPIVRPDDVPAPEVVPEPVAIAEPAPVHKPEAEPKIPKKGVRIAKKK